MVPSMVTVLTALDRGAGSLRDAIGNAKDGDTIVFASSLNGQTITLTSGELAISKSLNIEGPGAHLLAISGNQTSRVFDVSQNEKLVVVTIAGLTIENGRSAGGSGGGIYNVGSTLNLTNDVLSNNVARGSTGSNADGGGVCNVHGATLTVSNCTFSGNQAIGGAGYGLAGGGGIDNEPGGILSVSQSTFNNNRAQAGDGGTISDHSAFRGLGFGGGIKNFFGTATIDQCTFMGNRAVGGSGVSGGTGASQYDEAAALGGGIWNYGTGSSMTVSRSTFAYNQAIGGSNSTVGTGGMGHVGDAGGGGLETEGGGTVTITDSTFDHNQAIGGNNIQGNDHNFIAGWGHGGAISNSSWTPTAGAAPGANPSTVIASNLTITNNQAIGGAGCTGPLAGQGDGGGIENWYGGTFTISDSTIANNQAIGGAGAAGQNGADGLGGAIADVMGATFMVGNSAMTGNQAIGGAGGSGGNGGNGLGGGLYNQGLSSFGTSSLTVTGSGITSNLATGGAAGSGGSAGLGEGGGLYLAPGGAACLDAFTQTHTKNNHATSDHDDIFGSFTTC